MKSRLKLFGHACFSVQDANKKLIVDPWIKGNCFNGGWSLRRDIQIETLKPSEIDYVHITHEHPDHLNIESLTTLNPDWNPLFILQKTKDRRMAHFISYKLKQKVKELANGEELKLSENMSIKIFPHGHMDSYSLIKVNNFNILNVNDCVLKNIDSLKRIKKRLGNDNKINILLSQYSFASYVGNKDEVSKILKASENHINWVRERVNFFKPEIFIPFASHVNWCNEENTYLNNYSVREEELIKEIKDSIKEERILSYKNRIIELKDGMDLIKITRDKKTGRLKESIDLVKREEISFNCFSENEILEKLIHESNCIKKRIRNKNKVTGIYFLSLLALLKYIKPVKIKCLLSNGRTMNLILSPIFDLSEVSEFNNNEDIVLSADSLLFCLANDYGAETLWVNSRMEIKSKDKKKLFKHFYLSILNNQGYSFPFGVLKFFVKRILLKRP